MTGDSTGNITYQWKTGCSGFYDPIQFLDSLFPITSVSYSTSIGGPYTPLTLGASGVGGDEYWGPTSGNLNSTTGPFYFDITDARGQSVTLNPISVGSCGTINTTTSQFSGCGPTNTPTITLTPTMTSTFTKTNTPGSPTATPVGTNTPTPNPTSTLPGGVTATNCAPSGQAAGAQQQQVVLTGPGLNYVMASESCGGAGLTVTLPPGAIPVTAFLWLYYNGPTGDVSTDTETFNGHALGTGTLAGAATYTGWPQTWVNDRFNLNPGSVGITGSGVYHVTGSLSGSDSCQSQSIMVVYQDPSQMSVNSSVVVADGSSAWHIEENGEIAYGATPPNAGLNWACANMNCSGNQTLSMSAIGGNHDCGVADDWDQIISGGATVFTGPHDILDCGTGPDQIAKLRNYPGVLTLPSSSTGITWGFGINSSGAKTTYWQEVLAAQVSCQPLTHCSDAITFNTSTTGLPPGWITGDAPVSQKAGWVESSGGISQTAGCSGIPSQLLDNNVRTGPGTMLVHMQATQYQASGDGLLLDFNNFTGTGYEVSFTNTSPASILFIKDPNASPTTVGTASVASSSATLFSNFWAQVVQTSGCQFIVSYGPTATSLTAAATFTVSGCYTTGLAGF